MAIIFELWAETEDEASLRALADHFSGFTHPLLTGRSLQWQSTIRDRPRGLAADAGLSQMGVRTVVDALEATEAALRLYARLKHAPPFSYARIAWESSILTRGELADWLESDGSGRVTLPLSCVVDEALFRTLGSPVNLAPFRPGYWWQKYMGERYEPLYSNDQPALNDLCRELLPEYFS